MGKLFYRLEKLAESSHHFGDGGSQLSAKLTDSQRFLLVRRC